MTGDPWRLAARRFAFDASIRSDLARRVFPLFLTDWQVHGGHGTPIVVSVSDYARALCGGREPSHRRAVAAAFRRLVVCGWLVEGQRSGKQHTYAPGAKAVACAALTEIKTDPQAA